MKLASHYKESVTGKDPQIINWRENNLSDSLYYAYRATEYNSRTFPSLLHCHDYFELVVFEAGDIHYICESATYRPKTGDVLLIPPGMFHMSAIRCDKTLYKRHVFYLYPNALEMFGCGVLTEFLNRQNRGLAVFSPKAQESEELFSLLSRLDSALAAKEDPAYAALSMGILIQIFFSLNKGDWGPGDNDAPLPENVLAVKQYIDQNFRELHSISEIAAHFFYSREYLSRLFRKHFHTNVSEYMKARRVANSQSLIEQGCSISDACYRSGFENMSTFIRAFRGVTGTTPSEYRKTRANKA